MSEFQHGVLLGTVSLYYTKSDESYVYRDDIMQHAREIGPGLRIVFKPHAIFGGSILIKEDETSDWRCVTSPSSAKRLIRALTPLELLAETADETTAV